MLKGLMMDIPLSIPSILDYAAEIYGEREVVSAQTDGSVHRQDYSETRRRVLCLAAALREMGVKPGDRLATLAWNSHRHLELYYAIAGIGAVCHTINPRLFVEQIIWIANHADDRVLFFDAELAGLVARIAPNLPKGLRFVSLSGPGEFSADFPEGTLIYEDMLASPHQPVAWPELPEDTAAGLCYTSGTTGNPKGALYSHRSTVLHAMTSIVSVQTSFGRDQRIMPVVPLFHVNAWGLPFSAPLSGADLVMPGSKLDGPSLFSLMERERVTVSWGVPTIWIGLIEEMRRQGRKPAALHSLLIGGSAVGEAQIRILEGEFGIEVLHGWGMTELSPVGTVTRPARDLPLEDRIASKFSQGRRLFGVELKILDDAGVAGTHDGKSLGELAVRGNTVASAYFNDPEASKAAFEPDGWYRTGDVSRISPTGDMFIADRAKDLIKSGGEWISSIDLENAACTFPGIRQAAAIAIPDEKWGERPLLVIVREPNADISASAVIEHLLGRMAKWQVPGQILFRDSLPTTATGKISKLELRRTLQDICRDDIKRVEE